jgi:hypothetical protein
VNVQSGRLAVDQSVVGGGYRDTGVGVRVPVGIEVAVWVGVIVGEVVRVGVMLAVAVGVDGASVQVGGRTTFVPVGAIVAVG